MVKSEKTYSNMNVTFYDTINLAQIIQATWLDHDE